MLQRFAQRVLLLGAAAALAAIAYSIWHRWGMLVGAAQWKEALLYYALPLVVIAAGLALGGLWPGGDRIFALLIAASVFVALFLADVYFLYQYVDTIGPAQAAAKRLTLPFDARSNAQVVADLRRQGLRAAPFIAIHTDPRLITLGVMPKATVVVCNEFGPWFTPKTDRYGFVNPDEIWDEAAPLDAVIVGDSFAMGQCDPMTGGFAGLLRKHGLRILNLGIGGNDPLLDLASLAEFGSTRKSHFVFWMHYAGNDLAGLNTNRKLPILLRYVNDPSFKQHLSNRMPEIESRMTSIESQGYRQRQSFLSFMLGPKGLPRSLRLYTLRTIFGMARNDVSADMDLFERVLMRARDISAGMGSELVVINIPTTGQIVHGSLLDDMTADAVKKASIMFVDLKTPFRKMGDYQALYSQRDKGHFSPAGNTLVAKILSDIVAKAKN